jgi:hypothetical protein
LSEQLNLKQLERRAYRSTFQDGLWDLYLAGLMACLGILSITVLFNIVLVLMTAGVISAPDWLDKFGNEMTRRGVMDLLVPLFAGLFVAILMCIVAYFIDFYRGMYIGLVFGLGIFLDSLFDLPVILVVGAVLIAIPGLALFIRFIRQYPIQSNKVEHGTPKTS